jgi:hypothetical protein
MPTANSRFAGGALRTPGGGVSEDSPIPIHPNGARTLFLSNLSGGSQSAVYGWGLDITAVPQAINLALGIFGSIATLVARAQWVRRRALARAAGGNRCLEDPPSVCKGLPGFLAIPLMLALWNAGFNWANADSPPAFAFKFGGNGTGNSQLIYPQAISADSSGNVYVADYGNWLVKKFSSSGGFQAAVGGQAYLGHNPVGAVADGNGDILVVAWGSEPVYKFKIGGSGPILAFGYFYAKGGITLDSAGNILVADGQYNIYNVCHCVKQFSSGGTLLATWGGGPGSGDNEFNWPSSLAVDAGGYVYVGDQNNHRIVKRDSSGHYVTKWGSSGTGDGQFYIVRGLAADNSGRVYVVDENDSQGHGRVQAFNNTGALLTQWGSFDAGDTTFTQPLGVAVSPNNKVIYVSDSMTHEIKVFTYNTAPVLNNSKPLVLSPVGVNAGAPVGAVGTPVTNLVDIGGSLSNVSDHDASPVTGIAITAADATHGPWYFSTDNGTNWTALGTPSASSARLLTASPGSRVYLQPTAGFHGKVGSALTFRAWDQTYGGNGSTADVSTYTGGATAFSAATGTAEIGVQSFILSVPAVITGGVQLRFAGIAGWSCQLQRSSNLADWTTIYTVNPMPPSGLAEYDDTNCPPNGAYYRTVSP